MAHVFNTSIFCTWQMKHYTGRIYVRHKANTHTHFQILRGMPSRLCIGIPSWLCVHMYYIAFTLFSFACICVCIFGIIFAISDFFLCYLNIRHHSFEIIFFRMRCTQFREADERLHRWKWLSVKRKEGKTFISSFSHHVTAAATVDVIAVFCVLNHF